MELEHEIQTGRGGLVRSVWTEEDNGDTISPYSSGVVKTIFVSWTKGGAIGIKDDAGTVIAEYFTPSVGGHEVNIPFSGTLTLSIVNSISFTLILEV